MPDHPHSRRPSPAAILAFIPLTHSVFWGTLAYTLIGGTLAGTAMTLVFLPAMYAIWFKLKPGDATVEPTSPLFPAAKDAHV